MNSLFDYLGVYKSGITIERIISRERLFDYSLWIEITCIASILICSSYIFNHFINIPHAIAIPPLQIK